MHTHRVNNPDEFIRNIQWVTVDYLAREMLFDLRPDDCLQVGPINRLTARTCYTLIQFFHPSRHLRKIKINSNIFAVRRGFEGENLFPDGAHSPNRQFSFSFLSPTWAWIPKRMQPFNPLTPRPKAWNVGQFILCHVSLNLNKIRICLFSLSLPFESQSAHFMERSNPLGMQGKCKGMSGEGEKYFIHIKPPTPPERFRLIFLLIPYLVEERMWEDEKSVSMFLWLFSVLLFFHHHTPIFRAQSARKAFRLYWCGKKREMKTQRHERESCNLINKTHSVKRPKNLLKTFLGCCWASLIMTSL